MTTEDQLEQQALQWFQDIGWSYVNGADIAPEAPASERADFRAVVLKGRLASAIATLRDTLLPKLLSGELSVAALESNREAVR